MRTLPMLTALTRFVAGSALTACAASPCPPNAAEPSPSVSGAPSAAPAREAPPGPSASKPSPFPTIRRNLLANGMAVAIVEAHALPIVQLRVLVRAGSGYGKKPAAVPLTAELLKDGGTRSMTSGELLRRVETMGANLGVGTGSDGTSFTLAITRDHLAEAIAILGEVLTAPRFDHAELVKMKTREADAASGHLHASANFMAMRVIDEKLFPAPSPYAALELLPREIEEVDEAVIRSTYRSWFVPRNTEIVIAGDVDATAAQRAVDEAFGAWKGGEAPPRPVLATPPPTSGGTLTVVVADRPKSTQSEVFLALPAPARNAANWPDLKVAMQVLGGGVSGRLFLDVREQRSLAYSAMGHLDEHAAGHEASILDVGTQTPKTADVVDALLQNIRRIAHGGIDERETENARRYLSDVFAIRLETIGAVADLVVRQDELGLPDGYWDRYRDALRGVDTARANDAARTLFSEDLRVLLVVAGDAEAVAPTLTRFGPVTVVDPEHGFHPVRTLPMTPAGDAPGASP